MPFDPTLVDQGDKFYYVEEGQTAPPVGDGVNYSRALGWQSPEGNFYGQERWVRDWPNPVVWNGIDYEVITLAGSAASVETLPVLGNTNPNTGLPYGPRKDFEMWSVPRPNWPPEDAEFFDMRDKDYYFWDVDFQEWKIVKWYWDIDDEGALPRPGLHRGSAHVLYYYDIKVFWDGLAWRRWKHSAIEDDEEYKHLPDGFIEFLIPDAKLEYYGKSAVGITLVAGGKGFVFVGSEKMTPTDTAIVFNSYPAIKVVDGQVLPEYVESGTEYYVYYANSKVPISVPALPGDSTHNSTPACNFNGRLFLSKIAPVDDYIDTPSLKNYAIIAGFIETDVTSKAEGGPYFRHNLDFSWISRRPSFSATFRDYSDFYLSYESQDEIRLLRTDGCYGQIYLPDELIYLGEGHSASRFDSWISVDPATDLPVYVDTPILANTHYWIYLINEIDAVNFNAINTLTTRPWQSSDEGSETYYDPEKDLRLKIVLSTKEHEHYRMTETFPLFFSRCVGHIWTDANARFLYAKDISYIKSLVLNPTHFKGQADFAIKPDTVNRFKVVEIEGTAGVVYVGGDTIITLPSTDSGVHTANVTDYIQLYTEANITSPLSNLTRINTHPNTTLYVYMANTDICWGVRANTLFFSTIAPTRGYLSSNYPGTSARWIATVRTDANGQFTGSWLVDSPGNQTAVYGYLADRVNHLSAIDDSLFAHDSLIDFLLGWGSDIDLGMDSFMSDIWSDIADLYQDFSNLDSDQRNIMSTAGHMSILVESMYHELDLIDSDIDAAYSIMSDMDLIVSAMGDEISEGRSNLSALDQVIENIGSDVSGLFDTISDVDSVLLAMDSEISYMRSDIADVQSLVGDLVWQVSDLYDINSNLNSIGDNLHQDVSDIYSNINLISGDVDGLFSFKSLFTQEVWDLLSDAEVISALTDSLDSVIGYIDDVTSLIGDVTTQIESYEERLVSDYSYIHDMYSYLEINIGAIRDDTLILQDLQFWMEIRESALRSDYYVLSDIQRSMESGISNLWSDTDVLSDLASYMRVDVNNIFGHVSDLYIIGDSLGEDISDVGYWLNALAGHFSNLVVDIDLMEASLGMSFTAITSDTLEISHDLGHLWSEFGDLEGYVSLISNTADSLFEDANLLSAHLNSVGSQLNVLSGDVSLQELYTSMLDSQLGVLEGDLNIQSALIYSMSVAALNLQSHVNTQSLYLHSLSHGLDSLSADLSAEGVLITSLNSMTALLRSADSTAGNLIHSLEHQRDSLFSDISDLQILDTQLGGKLTSLSGHVNILYSNANTLSGNVSLMDIQLDSLSTRTDGISATVYSLSGKLDTISGRANTLDLYVDSLFSLNDDMYSYTMDLSHQYSDAHRLIGSLESNFDQLDDLRLSLTSDLDALHDIMDDLDSHAGILRGLTDAFSLDVNNLYSEAYQLGHDIQDGWTHLRSLSIDVSALDSYIDTLENGLISGYIGTIPRIVTYDWIGKRFKFEDQKYAGLPIRIDYRDTSYFSLSPIETGTQIVFPNAGVLNVNNGAVPRFWLDFCNLSPGNLYYIYLKVAMSDVVTLTTDWVSPNYWYISATPPTNRLTALSTRKSGTMDYDDSICIGYIVVTSTNRMSGNWNLWSIYHQPTQYWEAAIGNSNTSISLPGFIRPIEEVVCSLSRTGTTRAYVSNYGTCYSAFITIGSATITYWVGGHSGDSSEVDCEQPGGSASRHTESGLDIYYGSPPVVGRSDAVAYLYQVPFPPHYVYVMGANYYYSVVDGATGNFRVTRTPTSYPIIL
jgi:chromosome segregation ATPase